MHTNYRQDRAIQLTQAFVSDDYPGQRARRPAITYLGFTRYWDEFTDYLLGAMDAEGGMEKLLGEVVSEAGMRQLRIHLDICYGGIVKHGLRVDGLGQGRTPVPAIDDYAEAKARLKAISGFQNPSKTDG